MSNGPENTQVESIEVGGYTMYVDNQGGLHTEARDAIGENMRTESDYSRGAAGGCGQDTENIPTNSDADPSPSPSPAPDGSN